MKTLFIWWHRRRAAYHDAISYDTKPEIPLCRNEFWHRCWRDWHLAQIKRLEGEK